MIVSVVVRGWEWQKGDMAPTWGMKTTSNANSDYRENRIDN